MEDGQLTEILVNRDDNAFFCLTHGQKVIIAGVVVPNGRFNPLVADDPASILQTGVYILAFKPWELLLQHFDRIVGGQQPKHVFDRQATAANDWLAAKDGRVDDDP